MSKKLIVCRKNSKTGATEILREDLSSFVAQQCSKDIDQSVHKRGLSYYTVRCADDELFALEFVLDWIKKCGEQKDEVKVEQDVSYESAFYQAITRFIDDDSRHFLRSILLIRLTSLSKFS